MSVFYVNSNTPGEVTELDEASARLDSLPNWSRHDSREAAQDASDGAKGLVIHDGVLHRAGRVAAPTLAPRSDEGVAAPPTTAVHVDPPAEDAGHPVDDVTGLPDDDGKTATAASSSSPAKTAAGKARTTRS